MNRLLRDQRWRRQQRRHQRLIRDLDRTQDGNGEAKTGAGRGRSTYVCMLAVTLVPNGATHCDEPWVGDSTAGPVQSMGALCAS